ncbi:ABC transporter ATP-binding protein [Devosia ginsengisoli]|uniref:ABC transporter ATP-binding protein n=1 Tax=Devosia ginsengisoli TaxID=400770 RepID=UPI001AEEB817|nr:ATP-binding cassette domain-containing protein [Devosia ginsengisoli]
MSAGLVVSGVAVELGGQAIVAGVDMVAPVGQVTGLIGPNGAGKSTLLRAILGLLPAMGSVSFDGTDLTTLPRRIRAQFTAFVEQSSDTDARLTAREVVLLGRIPFQSIWQAAPSPEDMAQADAALASVEMTDFADRLYQTLSGGEQQRVQIARALAQQPRLLLLDEPTSHLDVHAQLAMLDLLRRRARWRGRAGGAARSEPRCRLLRLAGRAAGGRLAAAGAPGEVLTPALLRTVYGVDATILRHPGDGRPLIAYDLPG